MRSLVSLLMTLPYLGTGPSWICDCRHWHHHNRAAAGHPPPPVHYAFIIWWICLPYICSIIVHVHLISVKFLQEDIGLCNTKQRCVTFPRLLGQGGFVVVLLRMQEWLRYIRRERTRVHKLSIVIENLGCFRCRHVINGDGGSAWGGALIIIRIEIINVMNNTF